MTQLFYYIETIKNESETTFQGLMIYYTSRVHVYSILWFTFDIKLSSSNLIQIIWNILSTVTTNPFARAKAKKRRLHSHWLFSRIIKIWRSTMDVSVKWTRKTRRITRTSTSAPTTYRVPPPISTISRESTASQEEATTSITSTTTTTMCRLYSLRAAVITTTLKAWFLSLHVCCSTPAASTFIITTPIRWTAINHLVRDHLIFILPDFKFKSLPPKQKKSEFF